MTGTQTKIRVAITATVIASPEITNAREAVARRMPKVPVLTVAMVNKALGNEVSELNEYLLRKLGSEGQVEQFSDHTSLSVGDVNGEVAIDITSPDATSLAGEVADQLLWKVGAFVSELADDSTVDERRRAFTEIIGHRDAKRLIGSIEELRLWPLDILGATLESLRAMSSR